MKKQTKIIEKMEKEYGKKIKLLNEELKEEKESNTRMSVSPTNIMDGIQEQQHVETNNHVQHFQQAVLVGPMQKNESIKGRATSPTNIVPPDQSLDAEVGVINAG